MRSHHAQRLQGKALPRISRGDMRDLRRACSLLDAAALVLVQSGWSGKPIVLTTLDQVKQIVAGIYNKGEPAYLDNTVPHRGEPPPLPEPHSAVGE